VDAWKPRTLPEQERAKKRMLDHLGADTPITSVSYNEAKGYRQSLLDRGLSISTVNDKYISFAHAVFNHGVKIGLLGLSPFSGTKLRDRRKASSLRDIFTTKDLKLLFESKKYQNDGFDQPYKFWVPLLGLFTGARLEEICQLRASQVIKEKGIWCLKIAEDYPDQSVKTSETRLVPLHPLLTDKLGFHKWVQETAPDDRVFSELTRRNNRWGQYVTRYFKNYKENVGIISEKGKKVFHSFRHNVETILQDKEVDQKFIDQLTGHAEKGESARYGKTNIELIFKNAVLSLPWAKKLALHKIKSRWTVKPE
jgi:integrase